MSGWYLDSSAALKLVKDEPESSALGALLDQERPSLVGSLLLETEMRRAAYRDPGLTQESVTDVLNRINLHDMPASLFRMAGHLATGNLRSLDALHLAAAIRIGADHVVTYDKQMTAAAVDLGLNVIAPA